MLFDVSYLLGNPLQQECRVCSILCVASMNEKVLNVLFCLFTFKGFDFVHVCFKRLM